MGRPMTHLRTINPHVLGLHTSRASAGEQLPYLARQDCQQPSAAPHSAIAYAGTSAFAFQVALLSFIHIALLAQAAVKSFWLHCASEHEIDLRY